MVNSIIFLENISTLEMEATKNSLNIVNFHEKKQKKG